MAVSVRPSASTSAKQSLRLWLRMLKAQRAVEHSLRDRLRTEFGETLPRFDVLAALARSTDQLTMTALSRHLRVSNGNVTGIIDRLAEDGLVRRIAVANDRRAYLLELTPEGRRRFDRMSAAHEAWVAAMLEDVGAAEADALMTALDKVVRRVGQQETVP